MNNKYEIGDLISYTFKQYKWDVTYTAKIIGIYTYSDNSEPQYKVDGLDRVILESEINGVFKTNEEYTEYIEIGN